MSSIILIRGEIPCVSHRVIAENTGNEVVSIRKIIDNYKEDLEEFGRLSFEMTTFQTKGGVQEVKTYYLNEPQATLLLTYLRNSEIVRAFKKELVKQFYAMKAKLDVQVLKPALDYEGGKVAHILHGFKHDINPTAFLNVALISKFERMFGEKSVRDFYANLIGVKVEEVKRSFDSVASFAFECVVEDPEGFVLMDKLYGHYLLWANLNAIDKIPNREAFLRSFSKFGKGHAKQKRFGAVRHRGYTVRLLELEGVYNA